MFLDMNLLALPALPLEPSETFELCLLRWYGDKGPTLPPLVSE